MSRDFCNLHTHSCYSLLDGLSTIPKIIKRVKELNQTSVALTEHGSLFSAVKLYKECKLVGLKPIIGMEAYVCSALDKDESPHMTMWCENNKGFENLCKLSTRSYLEGFKRKPRILLEWLIENNEGLIIATGCLGGWISNYWNWQDFNDPKILKLIEIFSSVFKDRLYYEIHTNSVPKQKKLNDFIIDLSKRFNGKLVACSDSHYPTMADYDTHDIICALREGKNLDDSSRKYKHEHNDYYLHSGEEVYQKLNLDGPIKTTLEIAERCNVTLETKSLMPKIEIENAEKELRSWTWFCLTNNFRELSKEKIYVDRLNYELETINKLDFNHYFLIVRDIVNYCRENGIRMGPGRGSGAGSLVCYALGITKVDPIKYDLLFERFINPDRISPPDLDLDFDRDRRDEVVQYVISKFGRDRVANIITFGSMASKSAIKDVARTFGIDFGTSNMYTKMFDENESTTIEEALSIKGAFKERYEHDETFKKIVNIAKKLEGIIRQPGTHAAGIVIAPDEITKFIPLFLSKKDNTVLTQFDMEDLEYLGFLKMDFLGLRTLTVIQNTLNNVDENNAIEEKMNQLDDSLVYKSISKGDTSGVFQFEGTGITNVVKQIKPKNIEDLSAINALYRPGAMSGGMLQQFIDNKNSGNMVAIHPALNKILEKTHGILLYQESTMQMSMELANFTGPEADTLRKAIGKGHPELITKLKEKFINGCTDNKKYEITEYDANELFSLFEDAGYAFNRSHSLAYSIIGYYTAFLKKYYPLEYMTNLINSYIINSTKVAEYVKECKKMKIKIFPPCINRSNTGFIFDKTKNSIRVGLNAIKGFNGSNIVKDREKNGVFTSLQNFVERVGKFEKLNTRILVPVAKCGAFDLLHKNKNQVIHVIDNILPNIRQSNSLVTENQIGLFASEQIPIEFKMPEVEDMNESEKVLAEIEYLEFYVGKHPLEKLVDKYGNNIAIIMAIKKIFDKNNREMAFLELDTLEGKIETVMFADVYAKYGKELKISDSVIYETHKSREDTCPTLSVIKKIK